MKDTKVLVVDDNELNRKLFESLLGQFYAIDIAINGLEALQAAKTNHYHLILMDFQMPVMDGITALRKIRKETATVCPIVAVTAFAEESDRAAFLMEGFDEFVTKPIRPAEFLRLVQQLLKQSPGTAPAAPIQQEAIPLLDRSVFDQLVKYSSKTVIRQILDDFLGECCDLASHIDTHLPGTELTSLLEKIHMLKGNSGTLGAMGIYYSAMKAERYGKDKNLVYFELEMKKLKNEIQRFGDFLKQEPIFDT